MMIIYVRVKTVGASQKRWCMLGHMLRRRCVYIHAYIVLLCMQIENIFTYRFMDFLAATFRGILLPGWSSVQYTSAVFEILISEKLGWNVDVDTAAPSSSLSGMYNIMGCATPEDNTNRRCDNRTIKNRLMFESWHLGYPTAVQDLSEKYKAEMVLDAGTMGFSGAAGQYVPQTPLETAWNTTGLALEYYKSYDARCLGWGRSAAKRIRQRIIY